LCLSITIIIGSVGTFALSDQDKKQTVSDISLPNALKTCTFTQKDIKIGTKKAFMFIDEKGKEEVICTTEEDAEKAPKREELINGQLCKFFVTSENAHRIGIEYIPNSIGNEKYFEYMSDGTVRYYEVHPDDKDAKVLRTVFIVSDYN
jgi:hypothetical protein